MRRAPWLVLLVLSAAGRSAPAQAAAGPPASGAERSADALFGAHDFRAAFEAYQRITASDSSNARAWYQLGMSAANLHRYAEGAHAFAKAASLGPNVAALYNAGAMHSRLGQADSAFFWLGRAVASGFGDAKLLQSDDDLGPIRSDARFAKLIFDATHAPTPCADNPDRHKFDFWIGEWDVTAKGGSPVGRSSVQSIAGGCGLLENWTALQGSTGKSLNAYNPTTRHWQQYWVGQGGAVTEYLESEWRGTTLSFIYHAPAGVAGPAAATVRLSFTPMDDGTVRQHSEASTDGSTTWTTTYDFYYHRRP